MIKCFMLPDLIFCREIIFTAALGNSDLKLPANSVFFCTMNYFKLLVPPVSIC